MSGRVYALRSVQAAAGRSVIAANLAFELASMGRRTILIDLDHQWPSLHRYFNLPRQQASVVAAVRLLQQGKLDANAMEELSVRLIARGVAIDFMSGYRLATGQSASAPGGLAGLLNHLAERFDAVVADLPAGLDSELASELNQTTASMIWVTQIDPISLGRFAEVMEAAAQDAGRSTQHHLVLNRMRASVLGARPEWQVQQFLRDRTHFRRATVVPDDPIFDEALLKGLPLRQIGGKSKALTAIGELALSLQ